MRTVTITSRDGTTIKLSETSQKRLLSRSKMMSEDDLAKRYNTFVHIIRRAVLDTWANDLMCPVAQTSVAGLDTICLA